MSLPNFSRLVLHDDEATTESRLSDLTLNQQDTAEKLARSWKDRLFAGRDAKRYEIAKKERKEREDKDKKMLAERAAERNASERLEKLNQFRVYANALLPHWEHLAKWVKVTGTGPWYAISRVQKDLHPAWMYLLLGLKSRGDVFTEGMDADQFPSWLELTSSLEAAEAELLSKGGIPMPPDMKNFYREMKKRIEDKYVPRDTEDDYHVNIEDLRRMITTDPTWGEWLSYQYKWFKAANERAIREEERRMIRKYAHRVIEDNYPFELGNA